MQSRQNERFVMKVYTVEEVAAILRVDYKTVLRLIQRSLLKVLPGIRHKRVTEQKLNRYLDERSRDWQLAWPLHCKQDAKHGNANGEIFFNPRVCSL